MVSRYHLNIHRLSELRADTVVKILERTDAFRRPQLFNKLLLVCAADAQGKGVDAWENTYQQAPRWQYLLQECTKINAASLIAQGVEGRAIKLGLHQQRVDCIQHILLEKL